MPSTDNCVAYVWKHSNNCLFQTIAPTATFLNAQIGEGHQEVLARLPGSCDTFIFHIDLTDASHIPLQREDLCYELQRRGVRVVNGVVLSIAKNTIQRACRAAGLPSTSATREGAPNELLLLKTDCNVGGGRERMLSQAEAATLGISRTQTIRSYLRLPRGLIPEFIWTASDVSIERWIENPHDRYYRAYALGSRDAICQLGNTRKFKKPVHSTLQTIWFVDHGALQYSNGAPDIPARLLDTVSRFRKVFCFDFGALDILEDDLGNYYVIDANSTPWFLRLEAMHDVLDFLRRDLIQGIS